MYTHERIAKQRLKELMERRRIVFLQVSMTRVAGQLTAAEKLPICSSRRLGVQFLTEIGAGMKQRTFTKLANAPLFAVKKLGSSPSLLATPTYYVILCFQLRFWRAGLFQEMA